MKLIELVSARDGLSKLVRQDLPIRTAYELMKKTDECNKHLEFYGQERMKLGQEANPERLEELNGMEVEVGEKVRILISDNLMLSAVDIKSLEPIVEFYEEQE